MREPGSGTSADFTRRRLGKSEKLRYLKAVQCFLNKPAVTPKTAAAGVVSRYDDLVATHINQTMSIHFVVSIMPRLRNIGVLIINVGPFPAMA